jgi:hypothetical protein
MNINNDGCAVVESAGAGKLPQTGQAYGLILSEYPRVYVNELQCLPFDVVVRNKTGCTHPDVLPLSKSSETRCTQSHTSLRAQIKLYPHFKYVSVLATRL